MTTVKEIEGAKCQRPPKVELSTLLRIIAHHEAPHIYAPGPQLPKSTAIVDGLWVACRGLAAECMFTGGGTIALIERLATSWLTAIRLILSWHPIHAPNRNQEPLDSLCREGREYIVMISGTVHPRHATWPFWQVMRKCLDWCCAFHPPDDHSCEFGAPRIGIRLEGENHFFAPILGLYSVVMTWSPISCYREFPIRQNSKEPDPQPSTSSEPEPQPSTSSHRNIPVARVGPLVAQQKVPKTRPLDTEIHRPGPIAIQNPTDTDEPELRLNPRPRPGPSGQNTRPRTPTLDLDTVVVRDHPVTHRRPRSPSPPEEDYTNQDENLSYTPQLIHSSPDSEVAEEIYAQPDPWGTQELLLANRERTPDDQTDITDDSADWSEGETRRPSHSEVGERRLSRENNSEDPNRSRSRSRSRERRRRRPRVRPGRRSTATTIRDLVVLGMSSSDDE